MSRTPHAITAALTIFKEAAIGTADFIDAFLTSRRSSRAFTSRLRQRAFERSRNTHGTTLIDVTQQEKQRCRTLLYRLKHDGLIHETKKGDRKVFAITEQGMQRLNSIQKHSVASNIQYPKEQNQCHTIIIFDIPEREKTKRYWLRVALRNLDFHMVQKSVWMGKNKIPCEFLNDIQNLHISRYIEIFEVTKYGSLPEHETNRANRSSE